MPKKSRKKRIVRREPSLEKRFEDFSEEVETIGKKFERHESKEESLGIISPLVKSIIGIVFFVIGIMILNLINVQLKSMFILEVSSFFYENIALFFAASVLFNYGDYFSKKHKHYCIVAPLIGSLKLVFVLWIISSVFIILGDYAGILTFVAQLIYSNLWLIFALALIIGYVAEGACCFSGCCKECKK